MIPTAILPRAHLRELFPIRYDRNHRSHCKPHVPAMYDAWRDVAICGKCWRAVAGFDVFASHEDAAIRRRHHKRIGRAKRRRSHGGAS